MSTIQKFTDLKVWQVSHKLTIGIYECTSTFPKSEMFGLISQLRRASVSTESCIAEGFSRYHYKDRLRFYAKRNSYDSRGSIAELQCQLIIAKDLKYINIDQFKEIHNQSEAIGVMLGGLIRATEKLSEKIT